MGVTMKFLSIVFLTSLLIDGANAAPLTIKTASCKGYDSINDLDFTLIEIALDSSDSSNTRYHGVINGDRYVFRLDEVEYKLDYSRKANYERILYASTEVGSSALQLAFDTSAQIKSNYKDAKDYGKLTHASFIDRTPGWGKWFHSDIGSSSPFVCEITFLEE